MSKKSIQFHVESNDYFGTLAAILSLIKQHFDENKFIDVDKRILANLEKDLMVLQKNYKIVKIL